MKRFRTIAGLAALASVVVVVMAVAGPRPDTSDVKNVITGQAAFDDYRTEKPGDFRKITVADLPKPYATRSAGNPNHDVPQPPNAWPLAPL